MLVKSYYHDQDNLFFIYIGNIAMNENMKGMRKRINEKSAGGTPIPQGPETT